ncbi:hypothetical protein [Rothia mucilaginosa]|mgnify:FL=1|uniref:hypothetical protein n=1 Tax=Rothia mucilaginosa TaxID=43675 RepID=UPI003C784424
MPQKNSKLNVTVPNSTEQAVKKRPSFEQAFKNSRAVEEPIKRLTLNLPVSAHTRLKAHAAMTGKTMTDLLLEFIDQLDD